MITVQLIRGYDMYGIDLETQEKNWNGEGLPSVGQMVLHDNKRVKVCAINGIQVCLMLNESTGLILCHIKYLKPIPNPAETAKQKAIDEIKNQVVTLGHSFSQDEIAEFIYDNYTKPKVKPLPKYWYNLHRKYFDSRQLSVYEWLIKNGYCIGSADDG